MAYNLGRITPYTRSGSPCLVDYCNHGNYNAVLSIAFITSRSATLSKHSFQLYGA